MQLDRFVDGIYEAAVIPSDGAACSTSWRNSRTPKARCCSPTRPPFVAHLVPMRGRGRDIFSGAELLLYLTPIIQRAGPPPEILQALFDLSPAEARVAAMIAEGHSVKLIAENLSVQPNTVRAQLKAVFAKTGTGRQGELVSLLRSPS